MHCIYKERARFARSFTHSESERDATIISAFIAALRCACSYRKISLPKGSFINPLRMRRRVTVVVLCVCLSVCLSVTTLVARGLISAVQAWYQQNQHDTSKVFNTWITLKTLRSIVMALFTLRSARPYMKYCSYSTRIRIMTRKR